MHQSIKEKAVYSKTLHRKLYFTQEIKPIYYEDRKSYVVVQKVKSVMNKDDTLRKCPKMLKKNGEDKNANTR